MRPTKMTPQYSQPFRDIPSTDKHSDILVLGTSPWQFVVNELVAIIILIVSGLCLAVCQSFADYRELSYVALIIFFVVGIYLIYKEAWYCNLRYTITAEQMFVDYGVFSQSRCFMELYRVVDFYEHRTFLQRLTGIRTITIYSTDRTTPIIDIIGISGNQELVNEIRLRVEINRKRKNIYEFSNQQQ